MSEDDRISPIHYWGYEPQTEDRLIAHRLTRLEIVFRHKFCRGTDPRVVMQVLNALRSGCQGVYCVTQPDLMFAIPMIRRLFPKAKIATCIWTDWEARQHAPRLRYADHVFSLTDVGLRELLELGFEGHCSLGLWGCDPNFYSLPAADPRPVETDLLFFGLVSRDLDLVRALLGKRRFSVSAPAGAARLFGTESDIRVVNADSTLGLVRTIHSAKVSLIPLRSDDPQPTGFTNLTESLLCGTSVVIADSTLIPAEALRLPGVYKYVPGDLESFENSIANAVAEAERPGRRHEIRQAAAKVLNGVQLNSEIRRVLGIT
jgi:hypothetical protein